MEIYFEALSNHLWIILLFFLVALLYSSVGFGGGSSYLAILAISGLALTQIRSTALLCNIAVVIGNVILYSKSGLYQWKKVLPLILLSIPLSFIGGYITVGRDFFIILLGFTLFFAALSMWFSKRIANKVEPTEKENYLQNSMIGGVIGFISGMVGIGGGIFLAPVLHITHWDISRKIAATASLFIFANSVSGLIGQYFNPNFSVEWNLTVILLITVVIGGQIGSRLSQKFLSPILLKRATAFLIAYVSLRILILQFYSNL